MKKIIQNIYSLYAIITFVLLMILSIPFVVIAAFFGKDKGGDMVYIICRIWAHIWYAIIGIWHTNQYTKEYNRKQQYVFVANHQSYQDIPTLLLGVNQKMRVLGKAEMAGVPIFGFIYKMAAILVNRSSAEKRAQSVVELKQCLAKGRSIFIFPEGTFNESDAPLKSFYDGAFRIAIETQTDIQPILFPDTLKRMHWRSIFSMTPGKNRVIFLPVISAQGLQMSDLPTLKQQVYQAMEKKLLEVRN